MTNQYSNNDESSSKNNQRENQNSGNFKNDPERAREAGKKGGQNSHSRRGS